jgi:hypothetical protein
MIRSPALTRSDTPKRTNSFWFFFPKEDLLLFPLARAA